MSANPDVNKDLLDLVRAGVGQFGVMTSITIPLIQASSKVLTYKLFYPQHSGSSRIFIDDFLRLVGIRVDILHAFLKTSTKDSIAGIIGEEERPVTRQCITRKTVQPIKGDMTS